MAISDIVNPEVLGDIVNEKLTNLLVNVPGLDTSTEFTLGRAGTSWDIPYNKVLTDLTRDGEGVTLVPQTLSQDKYGMVVQRMGQSYKDEDIARMVAAGNPAESLAARIAEKAYEYMLARRIDILEGAIPTANRYDPAAVVTDQVLAVGKQLLGAKGSDLKVALMHSAAFNYLERTGDIVYQPMSNIIPLYTQTNQFGLYASGTVPTCAGMVCIQSDSIEGVSASSVTKYPIYLLGNDAMGMFWQKNIRIEKAREYLVGGGYDYYTVRGDFVMCLHGVDYSESTSPQLYTSAALKNTSNYTLKWNQKNVKAVRILTKVA